MKLKSAVLIIVCSAILLPACKQSTNKISGEEQGEKLSQEEIKEGIEKVVFPLPEPMGLQNVAGYWGIIRWKCS